MSFDIDGFTASFKLCQKHLTGANRIQISGEYIQTGLLEKECFNKGYKVETILKITELLANDDMSNLEPVDFQRLCRAVTLIRKEKHISQKTMIERMGIDRGNYYKLFRSNQQSCSLYLILRFAEALDSLPSYIYEMARTIKKA